MERTRSGSPERISSVREAINLFGVRMVSNGGKQNNLEPHFSQSDELATKRAREIHVAKMDIGRLCENKKCAEEEKARAESELYMARGMAIELARRIEECNAKALAQKQELRSMNSPKMMMDSQPLDFVQVMHELDRVKQDLSKLKLQVSSAIEAKAKAESEIKASGSKVIAMEACAENLRKEIEHINEEHVLVELARMEAERELQEIESQRLAEFSQFSKSIEEAKNRIKGLQKQIQQTQELERSLAVTTADVDVLQNEMVLVRAMEKNFNKSNSMSNDKQEKEVEQNQQELRKAEAELEVAKKELASYKNQGFQFMSSMDLIRKELIDIFKEKEQIEKNEKKTDSAVRNLNTKLLKVKSQLETALVADTRAKEIVANLSAALQQMLTDTEAVRRERQQITEESKSIQMEMKSEQAINSDNERLLVTMKELKAAKKAEETALKKLKTVAERAMRNRVCTHLPGSRITISSSEYEYLTSGAAATMDVANKKVAAILAWIEALKAEEKEMLLKIELMKSDIEELHKKEETMVDQLRTMEEEDIDQGEAKALDAQADVSVSQTRKSTKDNGITTSKRRARIRRSSASSVTRLHSRSPSFTVKKRGKVMPTFVLFLRRKRISRQK
ncbi:putative WEB family protein [Dioscorea sansibarensis]